MAELPGEALEARSSANQLRAFLKVSVHLEICVQILYFNSIDLVYGIPASSPQMTLGADGYHTAPPGSLKALASHAS